MLAGNGVDSNAIAMFRNDMKETKDRMEGTVSQLTTGLQAMQQDQAEPRQGLAEVLGVVGNIVDEQRQMKIHSSIMLDEARASTTRQGELDQQNHELFKRADDIQAGMEGIKASLATKATSVDEQMPQCLAKQTHSTRCRGHARGTGSGPRR